MATVVQRRKFTLDQNRDRYLSVIGYCSHFWDRAPSPREVSVYVNKPLSVLCVIIVSLLNQVSLLSLYSAAVENDRRTTSLHLCVSCCQGNLDDGDVWEIEQKCHFLGTAAILFVLDITGDARKDEVSFEPFS